MSQTIHPSGLLLRADGKPLKAPAESVCFGLDKPRCVRNFRHQRLNDALLHIGKRDPSLQQCLVRWRRGFNLGMD